MVSEEDGTLFVLAWVSLLSAHPSPRKQSLRQDCLGPWAQAAGNGDWEKWNGDRKRHSSGQLSLIPLGSTKEMCRTHFRIVCLRNGRGAFTHWLPTPTWQGLPQGLTTMYFIVVQTWVQCSQGPSSKLQAVKPTCYRITCAKSWLQ